MTADPDPTSEQEPGTDRSRLADPSRRSAARIATYVAIPVTLAVLLISVLIFGAGPATGPVTMSARPLSPEFAQVCQLIVADLPESVAGHDRRPVTDGSEQNAAYGDPPVTLECGTTQPSFPSSDEVFLLSGVCWHAAPGDNRTAWTTVDRAVPLTVTVPGSGDGSAQSVVPFSDAIRTHDDRLPTIPSGCA